MAEITPPIPTSAADILPPLPAPEIAGPTRPRYWLHALLFLLTCFTTLITGARMQYNFDRNLPALSISDESPAIFPVSWVHTHPERIWRGIPFMAAVLLFFLAHEMGHYLYCRYYGIYATLPFFIPMPSLIGTWGAVILIRSPIRSRTTLFDVGIAGPIAGFVVAVCMLFVSLGWSKPMHVAPDYDLGYPLIFDAGHRLLLWMHAHGAAALPLSRQILHPVAIAAWVGMFATSLNLLPGGQLDGGHILFSISPEWHKVISRLTILVLLPMAYYLWVGWWVWAVMLQLSSLRHPQVAEIPRIGRGRAWLTVFAILMLAVTLMPAPFAHASTPEFGRQIGDSVREAWQEWRRR